MSFICTFPSNNLVPPPIASLSNRHFSLSLTLYLKAMKKWPQVKIKKKIKKQNSSTSKNTPEDRVSRLWSTCRPDVAHHLLWHALWGFYIFKWLKKIVKEVYYFVTCGDWMKSKFQGPQVNFHCNTTHGHSCQYCLRLFSGESGMGPLSVKYSPSSPSQKVRQPLPQKTVHLF